MQGHENIKKSILERVHRDLEPSDGTAYRKTGVALLVGGALSLFLCGQFGMGLTPVASSFSHSVHHGMGPFWCAALCGALFAIVPVLILRVLASPVQFRALLRKKWQPQILWTISIGALLSYHGAFGFELVAVVIWACAAYAVFRGLGELIDLGYEHLRMH